MIYKFEAIQKSIFKSTVEAENKEEALEKIAKDEYSIEKVEIENLGLEDIKILDDK